MEAQVIFFNPHNFIQVFNGGQFFHSVPIQQKSTVAVYSNVKNVTTAHVLSSSWPEYLAETMGILVKNVVLTPCRVLRTLYQTRLNLDTLRFSSVFFYV